MKNLLPLLLFFTGQLAAQGEYSAARIVPALLKNADVVLRHYDLHFEVLHSGEAIETERKVLTLLNENAAKHNEQVFFYSKIFEIQDLEGVIYDREGQVVRRLKKKDITDAKPFEQQFVNDYRYKIIQFPRLPFPYTIEYTLTRRYHGLLHYPVFEPQGSPQEAVEYARFEVKMPPGLEVRFKEKEVPTGSKTGPLRWEFRNLPAFEPEPFTPVGELPLPRILTAPTVFTMEGYAGDMRSWQSFGKFIQRLNAGQDALPPATVAGLRALTADCPDAACKVRRVYAHLQSSTRYFFVGLGIGGWQPMLAGDVDQSKYGDCKGLSNYTVAMLHAVGVPAFYALIRAQEDEQKAMDADFPNAWFNHAIACVPLGTDTMWLECTSQTESCGFLGDFTDDRPALVIFPDGGRILRTPKYDETANTIHRQTDITLAADGSAVLISKDLYRGIAQNMPAHLSGLPDEQRKKYLYDQLKINDFTIGSLVLDRKKSSIPEVTQSLRLDIARLAAVSGKRLFLPISVLSSRSDVPIARRPAGEARRFSVQAHGRGITEEDAISIAIPEGFILENPFSPIVYSCVFGSFMLSAQLENGHIRIARKLILHHPVQAKEQYGELVTFLNNVAKADKMQLVLVH